MGLMNHYAMNTSQRMEVLLHAFFNLALDGNKRLTSTHSGEGQGAAQLFECCGEENGLC
jgi:hypothetical protein